MQLDQVENPLLQPVSSPTVIQPSSSPVAAPSGSCVDDPDWDGKFNAEHTCDYVALNPANRCVYEDSEGVQANVACPEACDSDCLCQDSDAKFTFKDQTKKKTCKYIGKNTAKRCPAASSECPVTCHTSCTCFDTETSLFLTGIPKQVTGQGKRIRKKICKKRSSLKLS